MAIRALLPCFVGALGLPVSPAYEVGIVQIPNMASALVLAATLLAALPAVAAETPPKQASDSADPLHVAPIEAERIHPTPAPPSLVVPWIPGTQGIPGTQAFVLEYHPMSADGALIVPAPMVLHVPRGYTSAGILPGLFNGQSLMVPALYPSFAPAAPAQDRCGKAWCGDELSANVQLAPDAPRRTQTGSVQNEMEASPLAENRAMIFQALPAPSGYEEAFSASREAAPNQLRCHTEFLVCRDRHDEQQLGQCGLESASPTCLFRSFDPKTHILMLHSMPITLPPQRQAIEDGLRALVIGWQAGSQ